MSTYPATTPTNTPNLTIETAAEEGACELATLVMNRYRAADVFRNNPASGPNGRSAMFNMQQARRLYQGILSPEQEAISEDVAGVKVNFVRTKAGILLGWLTDITNSGIDKLITINPTPIPELSSTGKEQLRQSIWDALTAKLKQQGYPADEASLEAMPPDVRDEIQKWLAAETQKLKLQAHAKELSIATEASKRMEVLIADQLQEADFRKEYSAFLHDFATMPFAVLKCPTVEQVMKPGWSDDRWGVNQHERVGVRRVNPWDFLFSADSTNAQDGSYVIERIATRRDQLLAMAKSPNWIQENVIKALEYFHTGGPIDWISSYGGSRGVSKAAVLSQPNPWQLGQSVVRVQMHGLFSGRDLARFGIGQGLDPTEQVEAVVTVLGPYVIQARLQVVPLGGSRPYHTVSFAPSADHAVGLGLPNVMADVQIAAYSAVWALMRNASLSSGARGEVDFSRIKEYLAEDATPEQVLSQPFHFVTPDMARTAGGAAAFRYHTIPNQTAPFITLLHELSTRADDESGVPALAGGDMPNATMGRAFRSVATLYGAATRRLKSVLTNIDQAVLGPMGQAMFAYNMTHNLKDHPEFLNLDAQVKARGTSGLLDEELKNQAAVEALQAAPGLVQLAQLGGTQLPPALVNHIVARAAVGLGVDISAFPELNGDQKFNAAVDRSLISNTAPSAVSKI